MLGDLGVDIRKNTLIDQAPLEEDTAVRRGAGRIRHIPTPLLWVPKLTQDGKVKIVKILGAWSSVDIGTKHLDGGSIRRALRGKVWYLVASRRARNHETTS